MTISGVLLLDKPEGFSSNAALGKARWLLGERKAGHTGTLDPFATGLLPLCFGEATKFSADLLDADKAYEATARLGQRSSTGDTEGEIVEERPVDVSREQLDAVLTRFRGEISQIPPMHSALKRDGKPLYELARKGIVVEREARHVRIEELAVLEFAAPVLKFRVRCSKGTYVRVLAEDIGAALGCGAHLTALRRIAVGPLDIDAALTLQDLESIPTKEARQARLAPLDSLLASLPRVDLGELDAARFLHGQRLKTADSVGLAKLLLPARTVAAEEPPDVGLATTEAAGAEIRVRVYDPARLLGTALLGPDGRLQPSRLIAA
ncbi:tRNA pseudouridine(55) synthase TruB [Derxia lacustris]|uniref:tRNA pseudouridine(55) synthase TruB n=1 Tax=Derxia lacustris TaxID=764842 RepID=UPI001F233A12|nr:tRNA pseudouridine(55) synthase TruB [Derxia lacustris]